MAGFELHMSTDNAAFEDRESEVARILREVAGLVADGFPAALIVDVNGNNVGRWSFAVEGDE